MIYTNLFQNFKEGSLMSKERTLIGAIILAAGMSKRMGKPKLLLLLNSKTVICHTLEAVTRTHFSTIQVITGQYDTEIQEQLNKYPSIEAIYNSDFSKGMATSLKHGIRQVEGKVDAAVIFLADQPFVSHIVVQSLIQTYFSGNRNETLIVRPCYQGELGHPVLIDKSIFHEFNTITGDIGGKHILKKFKNQTKIVHFKNRYWGKDIDTPEDLIEMKKYLKGR